MKNLMKLVGECQRDLASLNIRTGNVRNWSVNTRAKARWGYCVKVSKGLFDIQIAAALLQDDVDDQAVKDTIVHELLHTIPGCFTIRDIRMVMQTVRTVSRNRLSQKNY